MAIKMNGEVPFPEAGEGCFICFSLADIAALEEHYGVGAYYGTIEQNLREGSAATVIRCLKHGLKRRNAEGKRIRVELDVEEMSFPTTEAFMPIMDALSLGAAGQTYQEMLELAIEAQKKAAEAAQGPEDEADNPLPDSAASSDTKQ